MASSFSDNGAHRPVPMLQLTIDTIGYPSARDIARMLVSLSRSFETYARERAEHSQDATLYVAGLRTGSVIGELVPILKGAKEVMDLAEAASMIYDARGLLAGFATHMNDFLIKLGEASTLALIYRAERQFARDGANMISKGCAHSIVVNVSGSNNTILINGDNAGKIIYGDRQVREAEAKPVRPRPVDSEGYVRDGYIDPAFTRSGKRKIDVSGPISLQATTGQLHITEEGDSFAANGSVGVPSTVNGLERGPIISRVEAENTKRGWLAELLVNDEPASVPIIDDRRLLPWNINAASVTGRIVNIGQTPVAFELLSVDIV